MASNQSKQQSLFQASYKTVLIWVLLINGVFFVVESVAAYYSGSVALAADAVDFFSDAANYAITLFVISKSASARARAALFKAYCMFIFGLLVFSISIYHIITQSVPDAHLMGQVATSACLANLLCAFLLYRHRKGDSNRESAWLCSRNDAISNVIVIVASLIILKTNSPWPDVVVAAGVSLLYLSSAWQIRKSARSELAVLK